MGALGRRSNMINHKIDEHMQFESYLSLHIMIIYIYKGLFLRSISLIYIYIYYIGFFGSAIPFSFDPKCPSPLQLDWGISEM